MYRGKAYCEAVVYLFPKPNESSDDTDSKIEKLLNYKSKTVKITQVINHYTSVNDRNETYTKLNVLAEVLVQNDPYITHLNDYRVKACTELRQHLPSAGAIMAHSLDTFQPLRTKGFN